MDYQKSFEKLTEISIQWTQRNSIQQQSACMQTDLTPRISIEEGGTQLAQRSGNDDLAVSICISSKVEEKEEPLAEGESSEMVSTFSTEIHYRETIEIVPSEELTPPPSPPAEVEPEAPPSPPAEVEPELPPCPPEEVEPEVPSPPEEVVPEVPPSPVEEVAPEAPPEEVVPEAPPEEVAPEAPPEEVEPEAPPEEVEPEAPPEEVAPEAPPEEVAPEAPPEEVEPEAPPEEVEPEAPPEEVEPEAPPEEVEPEVQPSPPAEDEVPPSPTPPPEVEPEKPPTPPPEVEPEKPPTPPPEPEKPPTPPPEPEKPPTPPSLTPVPTEKVHRDVAHITLTTPGCEEEDTLSVRMARSEEDFASEVEAKTLEMSRSLTSSLKNTYESLLANLKDLPSHLQNKLYQTCRDMSELHSTFVSAHCFSDLSTNLLNKSFAIMAEAQGSMDELMEFALQSPKALLWLKAYFPPILTNKQETKEGGPETKEGFDMREIESNILKIQKVYEPGECYNDTLFVKKEVVTAVEVTPSRLRESEDIIKVQEAYDPQGCKDVTPSRDEGPSKNWGIMKILGTYVPKMATIQALLEKKDNQPSGQKKEEEVPAQKGEEALPSRKNILKLLRAYDPKGEESFDEPEVPDPDQREFLPPERADILKLLKAYEPQDCLEDSLRSKVEKEEMVVPQIPIKEAPSIKKVPPPVQVKVPSSLRVEEVPSSLRVEEVPSSPQVKVSSSIRVEEVPSSPQVKVPSSIRVEEVPSSPQVKVPSSIRVEEVPSSPQVKVPSSIQVEEVPSSIQVKEVPPSIRVEEVRSSPRVEEVPSSIGVEGVPSSPQVEEVPSSIRVEGIPSSPQVEEVPSSTQVKEEVPPPVQEEEPAQEENSPPTSPSDLTIQPTNSQVASSMDNILKLDANNSNNNEVPPSTTEEEKQPLPEKPKNLLDIQKAYEPKECEDGSSIRRQGDESSSSAPGDQVDILKIQRAYDLKECEEMTPQREEEASTASSWSIFKLVQSYLPTSLKEDASNEEEDK